MDKIKRSKGSKTFDLFILVELGMKEFLRKIRNFDTVVIGWENGWGGLGRLTRIFFCFLLEIHAFGFKKNLFVSARSTPSVFPL
jgi:hypothetical protein